VVSQWRSFQKKVDWILSICRAGRVAQVVECLPSKCEALSSNSSTTKINKLNASSIIRGNAFLVKSEGLARESALSLGKEEERLVKAIKK
jgi:hypothetical protein